MQQNLINTKADNDYKVFCLLVLFAFTIIIHSLFSVKLFHTDYFAVLVAIMIVAFSVQFPGCVFLHCFFRNRFKALELLSVGFFVGFTLLITIHIISILTGLKSILWLYFSASLILCIVSCLRRKTTIHKALINRDLFLCSKSQAFAVVLAIFFWFLFIIFYTNLIPHIETANSVSIYSDRVWHFSIVNALSNEIVPDIPWTATTMKFKYHYFADLFFAIIKRMTGISSDVLLLDVAPYVISYIVPISLYAFFYGELRSKINCVICVLIIVPISFWGMNPYFHLFTNINGVSIAFACISAFFIVLKKYINENNNKYLFVIVALIVLLTGFKAPFAVVILGGVWGVVLFFPVVKGNNKGRFLLFVCTSFVSFLLTYYFVARPDSRGQSEATGISIGDALFYCNNEYVLDLFEKLETIRDSVPFGVLLFTSVVVLYLMWACFLPFIFSFIKEAKRLLLEKQEADFYVMTMYGIVIVGIVMNVFM